jgi:hypothetical protein
MRLLPSLLPVALLAGCSFFFVTGPESVSPPRPDDCTESSYWPLFDGMMAGLSLPVGVIAGAEIAASCRGSECARLGIPIVGLLLEGAAHAVAAVVGTKKLTACSAARAAAAAAPLAPAPF